MTRPKRTVLRAAIALAALVLAAWRFLAIDAASHSASDTIRPWLIEVAIIVVAAIVVARAIELAADRSAPQA